ncbi:MAG: NAD(P)H-dependent flavin oxidoreductase [Desulfatibacillaceae bacterium]
MKTRITEMFGIEVPIVLSGMTGISTPELVAAVCNAGGLGILATGDLGFDQMRGAVQRIRELTDKPFGANVPLLVPGSAKKATVLFEEKVPVINYSLGKGDWICEAVHEYGGKVIATVTTQKHAIAAARDGADALLVTGHEAAAHGGEVTSLVLVPGIADKVDIPVIAAGGFADGRGLAAALAIGAEAVAMGTRFMNTRESPIHERMKEMSREKTVHDTMYSEKVDGLPCRVMRSPGADRLVNSRFVLLRAFFSSREAARAYGLPWWKMCMGLLVVGLRQALALARLANAYRPLMLAMDKGDADRGVMLLGQVTGIIEDTPTVAELVERTVREARECGQRVNEKLG